MGIFISHAKVDEPLVREFVEMLRLGVDIQRTEIFCTSLEGMGIPKGKSFIDFIKDQLNNSNFIITLISPNYYESPFCMCEMGATWILQSNHYPLLVPPLSYDNLKGVIGKTQVGSIKSKNDLSELYDRLRESNYGSDSTSNWEVQRDCFLKKFSRVLKKIPAPKHVNLDEFERVKKNYNDALGSLEEYEERIEQLQERIDRLKVLKNKEDVSKIEREYSTENEEFGILLSDAVSALDELDSIVVVALYYHMKGDNWSPKSGFGTDHIWEQIGDAIECEYLQQDGDSSTV